MRRKKDETLTYRQRLWFAGVLTTCFIVMLLMACSSCAYRQYPSEVPTMSDPAVAQLVTVEDGKESGHCTVFKVGSDLAMTAGHCCGTDEDSGASLPNILGALVDLKVDKPVMTYHAKGPHAIPGAGLEVLYDDDEHDVCLLKGKLKGAPLALALHDPALGARVWTAGYPKGQYLISSGYWSGRDEDDESVASIAVWGGASGSPVMDSDGRVVGVLRAYYPPLSNLAIIASLEWLRTALAQAK